MWAYRLLSTAMSQIGKPISGLDDLARYLQSDSPAPSPAWRSDAPRAASTSEPRPVYAGTPLAEEDDHLVFDATPRLTRQMDFAPDRLGYLVNSEGLVLMGRADDGEAAGLRLAPIRLDEGPVMPARATTAIRYKANLPRTPAADSADRDVDDAHALAASALAGGDVNIFDARGRTSILRLRWASAGPDRWRLLFRVMGNTLATSVAARDWQIAEQDFVFDARGRLVEGGAITLELGRALEPITLDFGRSGLTQFPDSTALVKVVTCSQNGWPQAALREVAVREDGRILGAFDNSRVELLGVAAFADADPRRDLREAA